MWAPTGVYSTEVYIPWIAEVEKRTEGRVKIVPYYLSALAPLPEMYDATRTGVCDLGEIDTNATPGQFPMYEVWSMVFPSSKWSRWSRVFSELIKEFPEYTEEMSEVKLLCPLSMGPAVCGTTTKPIRSLEDAEGVKLVSIGKYMCDQGAAQGFTLVPTYPPEFYPTIEKGVTEGCILTRGSILYEFGIETMIKYVTQSFFGSCPFMLTMNWDTWNSLPPDIQQVIDECSGDFALDLCDNAFNNKLYSEETESYFSSEFGIEFITLSPEELARWDANTLPLHEEFLAQYEAELPVREAYDEFHRLIAEYAWE